MEMPGDGYLHQQTSFPTCTITNNHEFAADFSHPGYAWVRQQPLDDSCTDVVDDADSRPMRFRSGWAVRWMVMISRGRFRRRCARWRTARRSRGAYVPLWVPDSGLGATGHKQQRLTRWPSAPGGAAADEGRMTMVWDEGEVMRKWGWGWGRRRDLLMKWSWMLKVRLRWWNCQVGFSGYLQSLFWPWPGWLFLFR